MTEMPEITWGIDPDMLYQYERDLPHWRQEGAVYFVAFRPADSIPRQTMEAWLYGRQLWLAAHDITPGLPEPEYRRRYLGTPAQWGMRHGRR